MCSNLGCWDLLSNGNAKPNSRIKRQTEWASLFTLWVLFNVEMPVIFNRMLYAYNDAD